MKLGFLELLDRAAAMIELDADGLKMAHTVRGRWGKFDPVHDEYNEMRDLAKQLRKAHKYHQSNPLGGPAKVFDAVADEIRAGASVKATMAEYGLKFAPSNAELCGVRSTSEPAPGSAAIYGGHYEQ